MESDGVHDRRHEIVFLTNTREVTEVLEEGIKSHLLPLFYNLNFIFRKGKNTNKTKQSSLTKKILKIYIRRWIRKSIA